ncbi:hypothetical protein SEPCBS119000_005384 [Sporothrix epigloea]|uniref:2EXR domain-containing protein n=1 Tax=Sporothrix epigloea TaxID=1892477 RepID=A0ABP0DXL2_9PEZI
MAPFITSSSSSVPPRATFSDLPAEIRHIIWTAALPRRVIGIRPHGATRDSKSPAVEDAAAHARHAVGSRMPQTLANVCFESRAVVTRTGRWTMGANSQPVWLDPERDTILLNSNLTDKNYIALAKQILLADPSGPPLVPAMMHDFLASDSLRVEHPAGEPEANRQPRLYHGLEFHRSRPASSTTNMVDAAQHQLAGCLDEAVRSGGSIAVHYDMLRSRAGRVLFSLLKTCAAIGSLPHLAGARLMVYFDEIAIAGTRAQAVASGLFGAAAADEEQMFFVPLSDRQTLERILAASKERPGYVPTAANSEYRGFGGLRVGNAGFLRELLRPYHSINNLRLLASQYLRHTDVWIPNAESEPANVLIERALSAKMPPLEQAILFRFKLLQDEEVHGAACSPS